MRTSSSATTTVREPGAGVAGHGAHRLTRPSPPPSRSSRRRTGALVQEPLDLGPLDPPPGALGRGRRAFAVACWLLTTGPRHTLLDRDHDVNL